MMRIRVRWFLVGLLVGVAGLTWAQWRLRPAEVDLTDADRKILVRERFIPAEPLKPRVIEVPKPYPVPGETIRHEIPVTEYIKIAVPAGPATVVASEEVDPPDVLLGGDCEIEVVGTGSDRMARALWTATASGSPGWVVSRGPLVADEVDFHVAAPPPPPSLRRMIWAGAVATGDGIGPVVGYSRHWRKWGLKIEGGLVQVSEASYFPQFESYSTSTTQKPLVLVLAGRTF